MKKLTAIAVAIASLGASASALADRYYEDGQAYGGPVYAEVLSAQPVYREVQVAQPRQECYQQQVAYRDGYADQRSIAGTLIGGLLGGVVGHQFGGGSGRMIATAAGAVIGAGFGNHVANDGYYGYGGGERVGYQERCNTVADYHTEQRSDGYDVTYRYGGRVYHTRTAYDPGSQIAVNVNVAPAPQAYPPPY